MNTPRNFADIFAKGWALDSRPGWVLNDYRAPGYLRRDRPIPRKPRKNGYECGENNENNGENWRRDELKTIEFSSNVSPFQIRVFVDQNIINQNLKL